MGWPPSREAAQLARQEDGRARLGERDRSDRAGAVSADEFDLVASSAATSTGAHGAENVILGGADGDRAAVETRVLTGLMTSAAGRAELWRDWSCWTSPEQRAPAPTWRGGGLAREASGTGSSGPQCG